MSGSGRASNLFLALIIASSAMTAGALASQGSDWRPAFRAWALVAFALALLLAAGGALIAGRRSPMPATLSASATESPGDFQGIELIMAVASVVASIVGAIISAVGLS